MVQQHFQEGGSREGGREANNIIMKYNANIVFLILDLNSLILVRIIGDVD